MKVYQSFEKRVLDLALSVIALLVLLPAYGLIALAIKLGSPGPVLFVQDRVGVNGSIFRIFKFRTMRTDTPCDVPTHQLADPDRFITPIGRLLRRSSLDELPQLLNIIKGDMSIVGPRPALWNQEDLVAAREAVNANAIRPGLTGFAQIRGRDELSIKEKARLDGEYCQNVSFALDFRIIMQTVLGVLKADGVREGCAPSGTHPR